MLRCPPRRTLALITAACLLRADLLALVRWDESRNEIFFTTTATVTHDSNITTSAGGDSDTIYTAALGAEYQRRAGLIDVDGSFRWDFARFAEHSRESFANPSARATLTKDSGRTTGKLSLDARRDSRADPVANARTDSWNYAGAFNFKYPVIERYSIAGGLGYDLRDYRDNTRLVDLETYTASADLHYVVTSARDLVAGYRLRVSESSARTRSDDHAFTIGVSGRILPKLNGTVRFGYQQRAGQDPASPDQAGYTATGSAVWRINPRASVTLQLSKDFSTTSTNVSIDSLAAAIDAQYKLSSRITVGAGAGIGRNTFLGSAGGGRKDHFHNARVNASYAFSPRLRLAATYGYDQNASTVAVADFERHSASLSLSSRF